MKVSNMKSNRTGKSIPNQFIITDEENGISYFQSYKSMIVKNDNGKIYLDKYFYNYSKTTITYRNAFLNEDTKTIEAKIKSGEYVLTTLNQE